MNAAAKTVLIAEDNVLESQLLRRGLENAGYEIAEAHSGEQALLLAEAVRPTVVLSDITMPGMDGYELCRAIRGHDTLGAVPVILLTDLAGSLDVLRGLEAGADAYVTKPCDYPTLVSLIESLGAAPQPRPPHTERRRSRVHVAGEAREVAASMPRMLNLLMSTYENAVLQNRQLAATQQALEYLNATLEQRVAEKTESLRTRVEELKLLQEERDRAEERRQALEGQLRQAQKMEALGTLAGGIAHDFNNILAAIGGNAELALRAAPEGAVGTSLGEIHKACGRAKDLVRRILVFSRREESERTPVALAPVVDEAVTMLRASTPPNVVLRRSFAPGLPLVCADASQVHQVIMNLGTNAAHAVGEHGGDVTVAADAVTVNGTSPSPELTPGRYLRITVTDTGTGISPEIVNRIFDPFFTTKGQKGTGLGLAMVHGIVRDHQGAITVASELGRGTTFQVFLPEAAPALAPRTSAPRGTVRGAGQHILFVDDEEPLVFITTRVLESLGYRCSGFSDAHAALQAFRSSPQAFDAVITDMSMPRMSGTALVRAVLAIRPDVPVAIATADGTDPDIEVAGVQERIGKPTGIPELSWALNRLVGSCA